MYFVGLDLGQRQNYTAVAVERAGGSPQNAMGCHTLLLRHLKRMALGTAYRELWSAPAGGGRDGGGRTGGGTGAWLGRALAGSEEGSASGIRSAA